MKKSPKKGSVTKTVSNLPMVDEGAVSTKKTKLMKKSAPKKQTGKKSG